MKGLIAVAGSVLLTAISWGVYGPVLHHGQTDLGGNRFQSLLCVGLAYFAIAVVPPFAYLLLKGEKGNWTTGGAVWSLSAGALGALGALGIILAFTYGGKPIYVMPLVFGCAPVINTMFTMLANKSYKEAGPMFFLGLLLVVSGAACVLYFKPASAQAKPPAPTLPAAPDEAEGTDPQPAPAQPAHPKLANAKKVVVNFTMVTGAIFLTAISWGLYGPILHKGQLKMGGSRLRPFMCVGLAYFALAVVVPILWLVQQGQPILPTSEMPNVKPFSGILWSLAGGSAGALGALGIILAFNFGGKPVYVMPLVFGGAPVFNTFTSFVAEGIKGDISPFFWLGLLMVVTGAPIILRFAPAGHGPKPGSGGGEKKPAAPSSKEPAAT